MQVLVHRPALTLAANEAVAVVASYDDDIDVDPAIHGSDLIILSLSPSAISSSVVGGQLLIDGWREAHKLRVAYGEATRRILAAFPEYSQRNSAHEINRYITAHGFDSGKWPSAAQQRKAEIDRCWTYIDAVRAIANAMVKSALPADPTLDRHWPTRISPYQPQ